MAKLTDQAFCKALYQQFQDVVLSQDDDRYEPVYEEHPDLRAYDHATLIGREIEFAEIESLTLLSGFRGSGKSTELNRLARSLKDKGFLVLQQDALNYLNPGEEIDIVTLLNALAGAFSDALTGQEIGEPLKQSYWKRLGTYLKTTGVKLEEIGIKAGTPAKTAEANLKLAFKTAPTFRQQLREKLQVRLGELKREVDLFIDDCRKLVKKKRGADAQIVFIFDQFEQIPGAPGLGSQQQNLIAGTKRIFADYLKVLRFSHIHTVLTVPSWLKLVLPNLPLHVVANLPMWKKTDQRPSRADSLRVLHSLVKRRFDQVEGGDIARFFDGFKDAEQHSLLDQLLIASGGHFRDLLRLMREAIVRAPGLPVTQDIIDHAIYTVRSGFLPIAVQDARALQRVADLRAAAHETSSDADIGQLAQFMNTHMVLYFINGHEWYDLHPLIREEVATIVKRADTLDRAKAKAGH